MSTQNRQWILNARPSGRLTGEEFRWNAEGQMLVRNLWLSFDPGQRTWLLRDAYVPVIQIGEVMQAFAVGEVVESRHPDFKAGRSRARPLWLAGLYRDGRQRLRRHFQTPARYGAQPRVGPARPQRSDGLFRDDGDRPSQGRRNRRRIRRRRRHGFGCGPDRQDPGLPCHWNGRLVDEAHFDAAIKRQKRSSWKSARPAAAPTPSPPIVVGTRLVGSHPIAPNARHSRLARSRCELRLGS